MVEDLLASTIEQRTADFCSQGRGVVADGVFADDAGAVGHGNDAVEVNLAIAHCCAGADRDLASAAKFVEQCALGNGGSARMGVVEEFEDVAHACIALTDL